MKLMKVLTIVSMQFFSHLWEIYSDVSVTCTYRYVMEKVDMVLVGAEGVVESGGIINKVGQHFQGTRNNESTIHVYYRFNIMIFPP